MKAVDHSDITRLAKNWEYIVERVEYPTKAFAAAAFYVLCDTVMRGQGKRMGSWQGYKKYALEAAELYAQVAYRVIHDDCKGVWFPSLAKLGFTGEEEMSAIFFEEMKRLEKRQSDT